MKERPINRPFPSSKKSHFQSEAKCEAIDMKMIFNYDANKTLFHNKGFALSLVLKARFFGTRKWSIKVSGKLPTYPSPKPVRLVKYDSQDYQTYTQKKKTVSFVSSVRFRVEFLLKKYPPG